MDAAVGLVQTYLRLNGYFTVTEYPVIEAVRADHYREVTDLDVLAVRFPSAGRHVLSRDRNKPGAGEHFETDPALNCPDDRIDMIVGEVKEGRAKLNRATRDAGVLHAMLARFGCCDTDELSVVVDALMHRGKTSTHEGHQLRVMAFGADPDDGPHRHYEVMTLGHIIAFVRAYIVEHWSVLRHAQFKDPFFGLLMTLEKARHHGD